MTISIPVAISCVLILYFVIAQQLWVKYCKSDAASSNIDITSVWGRYVTLPLWIASAPFVALYTIVSSTKSVKSEQKTDGESD